MKQYWDEQFYSGTVHSNLYHFLNGDLEYERMIGTSSRLERIISCTTKETWIKDGMRRYELNVFSGTIFPPPNGGGSYFTR